MTSVIDSKHQELEADEIIAISAQESGSQYTPEQIKASLVAETHEAGAIIMRQGNTLYVVYKSKNDPTMGVFRALNADTAKNYVDNSIMFIKACKSMGLKSLVTEFEDPTILNIFKIIARNPPFPGMGYATQKSKDGGKFRITINLGGEDKGGLPTNNAPLPQGAL